MATRTISASGGTRDWGDTATWEEGAVPTAADDVVARGDGTSGNLVMGTSGVARSVDFSNYTGTLSGTSGLSIGTSSLPGSSVALKVAAAMGWTYTGTISFVATVPGGTITCAGKSVINTNNSMTFNGVGGSWIPTDAFYCKTLTLTRGSVDASVNNPACTVNVLSASNANTRTLKLGSGTWTLTGTGTATIWAMATTTGLTFDAGTSTIVHTVGSASATHTFDFGGKTYNNVTLGSSASAGITKVITGANTFNVLTLTTSAAWTLKLPASTTTTVTVLAMAGTAGNVLTLNSSSAGTTATISMASGTVTASYVTLKDSTASGGATFHASHATIDTNVSGWVVAGTGTVSATSAVSETGQKKASGTATVTGSGAASSAGHLHGMGASTIAVVSALSSAGRKVGRGSSVLSASSAVTVNAAELPPEDLTLAWWFTPDAAASSDAGGLLTISGSVPDDVPRRAIIVDYDAVTRKFTLEVSASVLRSSVQTFAAGDHIFLAVRLSQAGLVLSVKAGAAAIEHIHTASTRHAGVKEFIDLYLGTWDGTSWGDGDWGDGVWGGLRAPNGVTENLMGFSDALTDDEVATLAAAAHRLDGLPSPEARLVWYVPFDPRPVPLASALSSGRRYEVDEAGERLPDDDGLTAAVAALVDTATGSDGLSVRIPAETAEFAAYLATTDDQDDLADHHEQFVADSYQEVRVR